MAYNGKRPKQGRGRSGGAPGSGGARERGAARSSGGRSPRTGTGREVRRVASGSLIEGRRAAAEALRTGFPIKRALVAAGDTDGSFSRLVEDVAAAGIRIKRVSRADLDAVSSHGAHQGIVLEAAPFPYAELDDVIGRAGEGPALVVVLDHVTDAGNFGAIVRTAEVVGAAGVVIASKRAAEVNAGAFKTSAGAVMHIPIARVPNIARALDDLKAAGFWAVGASEHADAVCWDSPLEGRVALVMGSEGEGISRIVLESCDLLTKLPQRGLTESLNVAQATTALCYEWMRRNAGSLPELASSSSAGE